MPFINYNPFVSHANFNPIAPCVNSNSLMPFANFNLLAPRGFVYAKRISKFFREQGLLVKYRSVISSARLL